MKRKKDEERQGDWARGRRREEAKRRRGKSDKATGREGDEEESLGFKNCETWILLNFSGFPCLKNICFWKE